MAGTATDWEITDIHAHLIPGLDDGPPDMADALAMCRLYSESGVRTVVATPHMGDSRYAVSAEAVRQGVCELEAACRDAGIALRILPGADVRLQPDVLDALESGRVVTLGDRGRFLLLELPAQLACPIDGFLFELQLRGFTAILTHPERHPALSRDLRHLQRLVERGCRVQITAASLLGGFGRRARRSAERMLTHGLVDVVASDAHHSDGPRSPQFGPVVGRLRKLVGDRMARELLCTRPARIIAAQGRARAGQEGVVEQPVK